MDDVKIKRSKDKVNYWMENSKNEFNESLQVDNCVSKCSLWSDCSTISDFVSVSQEIQMLPSKENDLLSNYLCSTKKVYKSCVKPTKKQLKRRQLPVLFDKSKDKSKLKLSKSIRDLFQFINDINVGEVTDGNATKKELNSHRNNINIFDRDYNPNKELFDECDVLSKGSSDIFSDITSDSDWAANKDIDLKNAFVKNNRYNNKCRLKLKPIYNEMSENVSGIKTNKLQEISDSPSSTKTNSFTKNNVCNKYNEYINNSEPYVYVEKLPQNLCNRQITNYKQISQQKVLYECDENVVNVEPGCDVRSKVSINFNRNSNTDNSILHKANNVNQCVITSEQVNPIPLDKCITVDTIKNSCLTKLNSLKTKGRNKYSNLEKHNADTVNKKESKLKRKSVHKRKNNSLEIKVNQKKPIRIKSVMNSSVLKSPGWSKLIGHMKELNILDEYRCNHTRQQRVSQKHNSNIHLSKSGTNTGSKKRSSNAKAIAFKQKFINVDNLPKISTTDKKNRNISRYKKNVGPRRTKYEEEISNEFDDVLNSNMCSKVKIDGENDPNLKTHCQNNNVIINNFNGTPVNEFISKSTINDDCYTDNHSKRDHSEDHVEDLDADNLSASVISNSQPVQYNFNDYLKFNTNYNTLESSETSVIESSLKFHETVYLSTQIIVKNK